MKNNFLLENFEALGTIWFIEVFESVEENKKADIKKYLENYILDFQNKYSRFLPHSILNKYNRGEIELDNDLLLKQMIEFGQRSKLETEGVFNLNIKDKLEKKGYGSPSFMGGWVNG